MRQRDRGMRFLKSQSFNDWEKFCSSRGKKRKLVTRLRVNFRVGKRVFWHGRGSPTPHLRPIRGPAGPKRPSPSLMTRDPLGLGSSTRVPQSWDHMGWFDPPSSSPSPIRSSHSTPSRFRKSLRENSGSPSPIDTSRSLARTESHPSQAHKRTVGKYVIFELCIHFYKFNV